MDAAEYLLFMDLFESKKSRPKLELLLVCVCVQTKKPRPILF